MIIQQQFMLTWQDWFLLSVLHLVRVPSLQPESGHHKEKNRCPKANKNNGVNKKIKSTSYNNYNNKSNNNNSNDIIQNKIVILPYICRVCIKY